MPLILGSGLDLVRFDEAKNRGNLIRCGRLFERVNQRLGNARGDRKPMTDARGSVVAGGLVSEGPEPSRVSEIFAIDEISIECRDLGPRRDQTRSAGCAAARRAPPA